MTIRESTAPAGNRGAQETLDDQRRANSSPVAADPARPLKPNSKRANVVRVFVERGDAGMNCFEAVRIAHDYVLRTTVSECARYHGITFLKTYEQVPGFGGSAIDCVRYVLTPEGAAKARELLSAVESKTASKAERRAAETAEEAKRQRAMEQERRFRVERVTA
jgi:hypothetical protein